MTSLQAKRKTINDYLEGVSVHQRKALQKLRQAIHAVAPKAKECISYGIPAFRLNGRSLVFFAAWANHYALYPGSSATLKKFRNRSEERRVGKECRGMM